MPFWDDDHTRNCVLALPATDVRGFPWLNLFAEGLCDPFAGEWFDEEDYESDLMNQLREFRDRVRFVLNTQSRNAQNNTAEYFTESAVCTAN